MDAQSDPSAVWIFRSELSTLNTSAGEITNANVQFLNGVGSPCNVWWKVASSATLGTGTVFIGNILALTSIDLDTGATLNGRALAQTGAVTLHSNTITGAMCLTASVFTPKLPNTGYAPQQISDNISIIGISTAIVIALFSLVIQ